MDNDTTTFILGVIILVVGIVVIWVFKTALVAA
jgi:hypothetical protein